MEKDAALKGFSDFMRSEVGAEDTVGMKWQRGAEFSRKVAHRNRCFTELNSMVIFHGKLLVITRW